MKNPVFEIEKMPDGTFTVRGKRKGRITRANHQLNTKRSAYNTIQSWLEQDAELLGLGVVACFKEPGKAFVRTKVVIGETPAQSIIRVKEINC